MNNDGKYHEKGVDVQLAVDLLVGAYENSYDTAILLSSDTDLIPAIKKVKELGKAVEYIGFAHKPTIALQTHATLSRLLIQEEIEAFVSKSTGTKDNAKHWWCFGMAQFLPRAELCSGAGAPLAPLAPRQNEKTYFIDS